MKIPMEKWIVACLAREKVGIANWHPYLFEALKGGILTTGALVIGEYLSGPRKGRAKWGREQKCRVLVSDAEVAAAEAREKERKSAGEPT